AQPAVNNIPIAAGPIAKVSNHIQDLLTDTDEFYEELSPFASAGGGRYNFDPDDLEPDSGNEFDFTVPDSAAALNEQAISRVFIKLDSAMPKLGSLGSFLSMVTTLHPDNVIRAESCRNHLLHLAAPYTIHHLSSYPPFVICFSIYGFSGASCPISPSEARLSSHSPAKCRQARMPLWRWRAAGTPDVSKFMEVVIPKKAVNIIPPATFVAAKGPNARPQGRFRQQMLEKTITSYKALLCVQVI
ncbi:hypothetical protein FIBSPDRAFT_905724, partial [Athelia psychrophila]